MRHYSVGIGCRKSTPSEDIEKAVTETLLSAGISSEEVANYASADVKSEEEGLLKFAESANIPLCFFSKESLNSIATPNETPRAIEEFGIRSVAEAAALYSAGEGAKLIVEKQKYGNVTVAVAEKRNYD